MEESGECHDSSSHAEFIGMGGEPPELKHLSRARKRNQRDSVSSGERKRRRLNQR